MFTNNKTSEWLSSKSKDELKKLVDIARKNKHDRIKKYKKRKEEILTFKMDKMEKVKLEKELKLQKAIDEKEYLTEKIMEVGGLVTSTEKFDKLIIENKEANLKNIIKYQILFRKNVLCQKLFQMGETSNNKYQPYSLEKLKNNYKTILLFSEKGQSSHAECLVNSLKDETSRQKEIEKKRKEMKETLFQTSTSKFPHKKMSPYFLGKEYYIK